MNIKKLSNKTVLALALLIPLIVIGGFYVYAAITDTTTITNNGDLQTTIPILLASPQHIDWGTITAYGTTTKMVTLKNNSTDQNNIVTDLTYQTRNWQNTSDLGLTLTWDYGGTNIYAQATITVTFTLTLNAIPENVTDTNFSFDILISATITE
jgi:hypothetical protein